MRAVSVSQAGYLSTFSCRNENVSEPLPCLSHLTPRHTVPACGWRLSLGIAGNSLGSYLAIVTLMPNKPLDCCPWIPPYPYIHSQTLSFPVPCAQPITALSCPIILYYSGLIFQKFLMAYATKGTLSNFPMQLRVLKISVYLCIIYHPVIFKELKGGWLSVCYLYWLLCNFKYGTSMSFLGCACFWPKYNL